MLPKFASSTRFGSIRTSLNSSGVLCSRKPAMIELMQTLLPLPVAPAMRRCGIFARSAATGSPETPLPSAIASFEREFALLKAVLSITLRMATSEVVVFGTSMPTTGFPGTGASMRIVGAASARARSFAKLVMRFTRTRVRETTSERICGRPSRS